MEVVIVSIHINSISAKIVCTVFTLKPAEINTFEYCKDNEAVRIEMPEEGSFVDFHDGQNQFKVPFAMYADFKAILKPTEGLSYNPEKLCTKEINQHNPSGFCLNSVFTYGEIENPLKLYTGEICVKVFCNHIENEVKRLYNTFPEKLMNCLTREEGREFNQTRKCHICFKKI